jgi:hypothetical protein
MEFLRMLEQSSPMVWLREGGSIWGYPLILFMHTLGLGTVAGVGSVLSLRVLGIGRGIPQASLLPLFRLVWGALLLTAISGLILLIADAVNKLQAPVFYIKMVLVVCAVLCTRNLRTAMSGLADAQGGRGRTWALLSLACWIAALTAGRLMAYVGPVGTEG